MWILTTLVAALVGCGSYADFTLPVQSAASHKDLTISFAPQPVVGHGDMRDALNPSIIKIGSTFYNLYSVFDGSTWRTVLATSSDGTNWSNPTVILAPDPKTWEGDYIAANGSVWSDGNGFWYWYQAGPRGLPEIGLARSSDGLHWQKELEPVIHPGPRGSWDERGVADPYVLKLNGEFFVYYLGQNRARQQQIGLARSPDGVHWTKLRGNPVLTVPPPGSAAPDENGLGEPAVWRAEGWYWMLFTGRSKTENRSLLAARSKDGVHWTLGRTFHGSDLWDSAVICDPTVLPLDGSTRLWFGGGDRPRPDENLHGQIGEGVIRLTTSNEAP